MLGNTGDGIYNVTGYRQGSVTIGGTTPDARNVISGNDGNGILIASVPFDGGAAIVQGNFIGVDATGTRVLGNSKDGVWILATGNSIGGPDPGAGNVISGNAGN